MSERRGRRRKGDAMEKVFPPILCGTSTHACSWLRLSAEIVSIRKGIDGPFKALMSLTVDICRCSVGGENGKCVAKKNLDWEEAANIVLISLHEKKRKLLFWPCSPRNWAGPNYRRWSDLIMTTLCLLCKCESTSRKRPSFNQKSRKYTKVGVGYISRTLK